MIDFGNFTPEDYKMLWADGKGIAALAAFARWEINQRLCHLPWHTESLNDNLFDALDLPNEKLVAVNHILNFLRATGADPRSYYVHRYGHYSGFIFEDRHGLTRFNLQFSFPLEIEEGADIDFVIELHGEVNVVN